MERELIKIEQVRLIVPLSKPSIYRLMAINEFPKPVQLGGRSVFWIKHEIESYVQNAIDKKDNK